MLEKAKTNSNTAYFPFCNSAVLRPLNNEKYTIIQGKKSFSKSQQKKLKLLKNRISSQKSLSGTTNRKIKPLKVLLKNKQATKPVNNCLCSIQTFKQKLNLQKQLTDSKQPKHQKIIPIKCSQSKKKTNDEEISINKFDKKKYQKVNLNNTLESTSFGLNEGAFNYSSLAPSFGNSTVHQVTTTPDKRINKSIDKINSNFSYSFQNLCLINKKFDQCNTPDKIYTAEENISTENIKREKLTLKMARKVQTFETFKTQHSQIETSDYKLFFSQQKVLFF